MSVRHDLRGADEDAGMTLVEVAVTALLLSIVILGLFSFLEQMASLTTRTDRQAQLEGDTQLAMRVVTQNVRSAGAIPGPCESSTDTATPSLPAGYDNCLRFSVPRVTTGFVGCARTEFVYAIVGTGTTKQLVENRQEFTGTTSCTAQPVRLRRVLLDNVENTSSQPLFTYLRANGTRINTATSPAEVPKAITVKLSLRVRAEPRTPVIAFTSSAALRNNR